MKESENERNGGVASTLLPGWGAGSFALLAAAVGVVVAGLAVMLATVATAQTGESGYQKKESPLTTPWTDEVGPNNALPDYPRPQMERDQWRNLNGVWQFAGAEKGDAPPVGKQLDERILVPYPVESALSGIKRHESRMFYRRTFEVPRNWGVAGRGKGNNGQQLLMHFGAVDYEATVWVNGEKVGTHKGGYDDFTVDVTDALEKNPSGKPKGKQEILVGVVDQTDRGNRPFARPYVGGGQPVGKQTLNPGGIFYTPNSGIWQTVWVEPVEKAHIQRLDTTPNLDNNTLELEVDAANAQGKTVQATAYDGDRKVGTVTGPANQKLSLPVENPELWSPDNPFLYDLKVRLVDDAKGKGKSKAVDEVNSYFGMRSVSIQKGEDGEPRMFLNGEFVPNVGTLDQGYWPDGVYTAPTDEALKFDLEEHKKLGYNMVRKHIKVEPDRWYYHADKLGLIVWQDMPSFPPTYDPSPADQQQFESELGEMIKEHQSFPSITTWVPYNEGWGELNKATTARVAKMVKDQDPSRLVDTHSGVNCCESEGDTGTGDIYDEHNYQEPPLPEPFDARATVAGEYGGVALQPAPEHEYDSDLTFAPYGAEPNSEALTTRYEDLLQQMKRGVQSCGVSASVYTEITDLEGEINGMYTYDRQVFKPASKQRIRQANQSVIDAGDQLGDEANYPPGKPGLEGVSYYPFSEGSGNTTADQADGNDATLENGPQWTAGPPGSPGGSGLNFDGQDDIVDTGASILDTTGNYSAAAWVKLDNTNGFKTVISQDGDQTSAFFLQYSDADNRFAFSFAGTRALAPEPPQTGQWYHLTGVRDAASGQLKLYVDGELAGTANACLGQSSSGDTVIGRGKFNGNPVDYWDGGIDQAHVYDRALSDGEVRELYQSGK
jgi:hypothetical protein